MSIFPDAPPRPTLRRAALLLLPALLAAAGARADTVSFKVTDQGGRPLIDAVVLAVPAKPPPPPRAARVAIEQKDRDFLPFVTAVQVGTAVTFPNKDPMLHHVYSFSPAKVFEIKLNATESPSVLFDKPGPVALGCNIHDWMEAYIYVAPTPYFARTDAQGNARLTVPAGAYSLEAWHPYQTGAPPPAAQVSVAGSRSQAFTLPVSVPQRKPKPPHDPKQYGG